MRTTTYCLRLRLYRGNEIALPARAIPRKVSPASRATVEVAIWRDSLLFTAQHGRVAGLHLHVKHGREFARFNPAATY